MVFEWNDPTPASPVSLHVRIPRDEYYWIKTFDLKAIKQTWPCGETGYTKEDQVNLLNDLGRFYAQEFEDDGDYVVVTESYYPPKSGFPGRLNSPGGCQGLVRAVRSNLLKETADLDMNSAMQRAIVWACKQFGILVGQFEFYIHNRDGPNGMLQRIMDEHNVSKGKAKQLGIMTLTSSEKLRTRSAYLKKLDVEAKEMQAALMVRPELQWILPYCKEDNRAGSFMCHLYHFIECKLLMRVCDMLVNEMGIAVAALVFDGLNVADKSKHGDQAILDRARAACEEVAPGINMPWAWKELDFVLESKEKQPLTNPDGSLKELRVPEGYEAPAPVEDCGLEDADGEGSEALDEGLDPETQPTYEQLRHEFSLNLGGNHGKVGCEYIEVDLESGKVELYDTAHFRAKYRHLVHFEEKVNGDGAKTIEKGRFIDRWMSDERMDPRYLDDKTKRYYWKRFDMYPVATDCPADVYNLWSGFAAEQMDSEYDEDKRAGLLLLLEHIAILCDRNAAQYNFMLNILAHAVQYPNVKLGIMLCLVGLQGCGKGHVWEMIERLVGSKPQTFSTDEPQKDVWGDNNGQMKHAFFVRIAEVARSAFTGMIGKMRGKITDNPIRVRDLYCTAANVKNYSRFFLDTNYTNAIPDEHGERRFFTVKCSEDKIGDTGYFEKLRAAIADDCVIHAFFQFLKARKIKPMYLGKDIPIGDYQKALKDANRSVAEHFLEWFVQEQPISKRSLIVAIDDVCDTFRGWQQTGGEFERSKTSITSELALRKYSGIDKIKPLQDVFNKETGQFEKKQVPKYVFDLEILRKRFGIGVESAPAPLADAIDCEADIVAWEQQRDGGVGKSSEGEAGPSGTSPEPMAEAPDDSDSSVGRKRPRSEDSSDDEA